MLKIAVIGCGAVVEELYRRPLLRLQSAGVVTVVALADPNGARTAHLRRAFPSAGAFDTPQAAYRLGAVDLSIIASPPSLHAEHALVAFDNGSHVLCEKPLSTSAADATRMVVAGRRAGRLLAVGMPRRFYPSLACAQMLVQAGELGDELRFAYREGGVYGWPVSSAAAFRRPTSGGGVLTDKGPHGLDLLMALFGPPHVTRCEDDALRDGVEANSRVGLEFARATGFMQVSWDQPLVDGVHVTGSRGELKLDLEHPDRLMWRRSDGLWQPLVGSRDWPTDLESPAKRRAFPRAYSDCIHYQLVQVLRSIVHLEPLPVTGDDGLRVVRAIERCYELARPLALPWLSADEQERSSALHWSHPR